MCNVKVRSCVWLPMSEGCLRASSCRNMTHVYIACEQIKSPIQKWLERIASPPFANRDGRCGASQLCMAITLLSGWLQPVRQGLLHHDRLLTTE